MYFLTQQRSKGAPAASSSRVCAAANNKIARVPLIDK